VLPVAVVLRAAEHLIAVNQHVLDRFKVFLLFLFLLLLLQLLLLLFVINQLTTTMTS